MKKEKVITIHPMAAGRQEYFELTLLPSHMNGVSFVVELDGSVYLSAPGLRDDYVRLKENLLELNEILNNIKK